jgi:DNA-binding MarR family transcriptional regulator
MNGELHSMIESFLRILHIYAAIQKKPKDFGTGDLLFVSEIHTIAAIGHNPEINITHLAEITGVTKGAISQIVKRLLNKRYIARYNNKNNKEVNLRLSDKGYVIFRKHEAFEKEIFVFAEQMYDNASPAERDLVKRLFELIYTNILKVSENI